MNLPALYLGLAITCSLVATYFYTRDILSGKTKPHMFTWLIWGTSGLIVFYAQIWDKGGLGAWATAFAVFRSFLYAFLAIWYGEKTITKGDWISLLSCLVAIPLWLLTKSPLYSVIWLVIIETIAFYPTFRKSWTKPQQETLLMYNLSSAQYFFGLLALANHTIVTVLYGAVMIIINTAFVAYTKIRRKAMAGK